MPYPIRAGDPVIINEFDAPQTNMIVVVTSVEKDRVEGHYLSRRKRKDFSGLAGASGHLPTERVTHIRDFGMKLVTEGDVYFVKPTGEPSTATYHDGESRQWQEQGFPKVPFDKRSLRALSASEFN